MDAAVEQTVKVRCIALNLADQAADLDDGARQRQRDNADDEHNKEKKHDKYSQAAAHMGLFLQKPGQRTQDIGDDARCQKQHEHIPKPRDHGDRRDEQNKKHDSFCAVQTLFPSLLCLSLIHICFSILPNTSVSMARSSSR